MPSTDVKSQLHFPPRWGVFADRQNLHPIRAELFSLDHLEVHAQQLGELLSRTRVEVGRPLPRDFAENADKLRAAHSQIGEAYRNHESLGSDAEWLMDNYHIIRETLAEIRTDLPNGYYHRLPKLVEGPLVGYPRVYALALDLIAHCDSGLDDANITRFVQAFQTAAPLTVGEIWAVPIMLRLCLIENLRRLAAQIVQFRAHRHQAHTWITEHLPALQSHAENNGFYLKEVQRDWRDCYIVHLLDGLHDHAVVHPEGVERLEKTLADTNDSSADVLRREKQRQAANQVSIGNCVTSLRLLSAIDWSKFFERTSKLEAILRQDPLGIHPRQDFATRDRYRRVIEKLARGAAKDELVVAKLLLEHAREAHQVSSDPREGHIGFYLVDQGMSAFEKALNYRAPVKDWISRHLLAHPGAAYFGGITVLMVVLLAGLAWAFSSVGPAGIIFALLMALIPISELAVGLINFLAVTLLPPRTLPSMDFKEGVPPDCSTFVVVPCLLTSDAGAVSLVERLEIHYLSNPEKNVLFGLLSDFTDAPSESMPEDAERLRIVEEGIRSLNEKYCPDQPAIFFLLHRRRQWNPAQSCWMGWERKRGKLSEFNRWLRGAKDTSFTTISSALESTPRIRFVITLDADTQLPRETARRMIALLAHPLNQPHVDAQQQRVTRGYGILQPRIGLSLRGAHKSLFARLFSGSAGLDPYTTAVSDTYQDLFGSGSFTGKGIYDVDAFATVVGAAFPDNHILSHDLIEGNYARCGLTTEIELLDDFPNHYLAYVRREHRWMRGDWQILPWLFGSPPGAHAKPRANSLPLLERWKILDNLRRSLTPIALIVMLVLGCMILPGSAWVVTGLAALVLSGPLILQMLGILRSVVAGWMHGRSTAMSHREIGSTAGQVGLGIIFLAGQSFSALDAIGRTLYRVWISKRDLLEWESAAATERRLNFTLSSFVRAMWPAPAFALALGVLLAFVEPGSLLPAATFLLAWFLSPWVAYFVSRPLQKTEANLTAEEKKELRRLARKTWTFFETFVGAEDHWLPPDNYQEDPKNETARRTSPTNIGLYLLSCVAAHDFGYLSFPALVNRLEKTMDSLDAMEQSHGHFYNWYDTRSLQPLPPLYLSTVDSGNLVACFIALKQSLLEKLRVPLHGPSVMQGIQDTVAQVERCVHYLETAGAPANSPIHNGFATHLKSMTALTTMPPAGAAEWSVRLRELTELEGMLEQQTDNLQSIIEEPPADLRRWIMALSGLLRERREEVEGMMRFAGEHSKTVDISLVTLADAESKGVTRTDGWAQNLLTRCHELLNRLESLTAAMDFKVLYNRERNLFAVGYNLSLGKLDDSHYDLLASEASLTSFLAIARGEAPRAHWFHLGRPLTEAAGHRVLLSWGGTMFEYLMPRLFLSVDSETLLGESQTGAVAVQIDYGKRCGTPWGISESAFNQVDGQLNYQYQAFGAPALGLKRGLGKDLVIAPYATGLAFLVNPRAALENLRRLREESAENTYGWYEAIDYTAERLPKGRRSVVVKCYMAHHQGMTLLGLANCLLNSPVPRRFRAEPMVRATELLLQERVPAEVPLAEPQRKEAGALTTYHEVPPQMSRRVTTPHTAFPRTHVLASARHSLIVTSAGSSWSNGHGVAVTRWREDRTCDSFGQFYYIRDLQNGITFSAAYQPSRNEPDEYEVTFSADKVDFHRRDGALETRMEITVSPENHAEVWRLTIANHDHQARDLEVTSYLELVLSTQAADLAHPAFGKLFLETEFLPDSNALLCRRRPRAAEDKPIWCLHLMTVEGAVSGPVEYETDRARFLGRGRTPADPAALDVGSAALSGSTGPVLDPIFSLRRRFHIEAGSSIHVAFTTAMADSREEALAIADSYTDYRGIHRAFELAWAHTQVELRQLHLTPGETHLFQRLATHFLFAGPVLRPASSVVASNRQGQADLWRLGLSGDLPIVLLRLNSAEHLPLARQVIAAHSFWRLKGLSVDLVILNEDNGGYFEELQQQLQALLRASEDRGLLDKPGGVFLRRGTHLTHDDQILLQATARCVLLGSRGLLGVQLDRLERMRAPVEPPTVWRAAKSGPRPENSSSEQLTFDNGLGGFSADGREYVMRLTAKEGRYRFPPQPWVNVVANPLFGFVASESGGGFTWAGNSQNNRLTPWRNDPVSDAAGEVIYLRDDENHQLWTTTPMPRGADASFTVRHGQGYTVFSHERDNLAHELALMLAPDEPMKFYRLKLRNLSSQPRRLTAFFYAELVLGTVRDRTVPHIVTEIDSQTGALLARNTWDAEYRDKVAFADANRLSRTVSGDRTEFIGRNGSLSAPAACGRDRLTGTVGACLDPCLALQMSFTLGPREEKEIVFVLGQTDNVETARRLVTAAREPGRVQAAWDEANRFWNRMTGTLTIRTPDAALDTLVNRWLPYQVLSCRMWARSAVYQSGGAYGFRDQLQDSLALVYAFPDETRRHLVRAASRQFTQGDVQHWWHPPSGAGVRTRISDDYLWLPFAVHHYVVKTGDYELLNEQVPFLEAPELTSEQHEDYRVPKVSEETATIFDHCRRAIERGRRYGIHGLPLMGDGDWNDGMNRVGADGRGESVWLGWFLATVLVNFADLCERCGDSNLAESYRAEAETIRTHLEQHAWDGSWYRRAYFDDGTPLGSAENSQCRIDSLPQAWSVISGKGDPQRSRQAMESVNRNLVRNQDGLVLLFTPPFDKGALDPGYIKGYLPGIRENGGQYTHAALWAANAWALLGEADRALEILDLINPILHSNNPEAVNRYRLEPFVLAADVYSKPPLVGRGGWSWYTGSASWYYRVVMEILVGFDLRGDKFRLKPRLPAHWPSIEITYRFHTTVYSIKIERSPENTILFDQECWHEEFFPIVDDGKNHRILISLK